MSVTVYSAQVVGLEAKPISVEVDVSRGLHIFSIVGLADKEVQESRERISAAIKNLGALAPHKKAQRVIVNLAPADIKKEGPAFDLPIALGYLLASEQISFNPALTLFLGELGLDGALRKVAGILPIALTARAAGFERLILPKGNGAEAAILEGIRVIEVENLLQAVEHLSGRTELSPLPVLPVKASEDLRDAADFSYIRGQTTAKFALEIAAAGGHNVLMFGPPGAGKTILAKALPSILPPPSFEETLEVTRIYSVSGLLNENVPFVSYRPFRNPHHTSSHTAIIGGGSYPRPGEITLAHRGVLFLDEFPEFDRRVIESLREPLEERKITVARTHGTETFPAHFMLVAAMNPCPCGNYGNPVKECSCSPGMVSKYKKKISGPMLDRIDIHIEVPAVEYEKLAAPDGDETPNGRGARSSKQHLDERAAQNRRAPPSEAGREGEERDEDEPSEKIRERVIEALEIQGRRFGGLPIRTNSEMGLREIKQFIKIGGSGQRILKDAHERYHLSARSYHRVLKLSRTVADLEGSEEIKDAHLQRAIMYRPKLEL